MVVAGNVIAGREVVGAGAQLASVDPATGAPAGESYAGATVDQVNEAGRAAWSAFDDFRRRPPETRALLLEAIATGIEDLGDALIRTVISETGLGEGRVAGERTRTTNQLRLFASLLRGGSVPAVRIDPGNGIRPDLRLMRIGLGPVAVFGASNFPLAFSTAGGDTASALAAGCPVIVKAHGAHLSTSLLVARVISCAVDSLSLPSATFQHLMGGRQAGLALVRHPAVRAVGFTGSRAGGLALARAAFERAEPIPVYAEMSSINPVLVLPGAVTPELAAGFVESLTLGSGQFCTNPGLLFVPTGEAGDRFVAAARDLVAESVGQTMLTSGIADAFTHAAESLSSMDGVCEMARGAVGTTASAPAARLLEASLARFAAGGLQEEMFGAAALIVRYEHPDDLVAAAEALDGQLTATIHFVSEDAGAVATLLPVLERKAGRLIANGWPTGVEVSHAMVHGGPFPATSDARTTSVGTLAIERFLRPVAFQGFDEALLAPELSDANPLGIERRVSGVLQPNT